MYTPLKVKNTTNCLPLPWHPSVVYIPEGWNGHQYWMAQTPFPPFEIEPYRDRYELPCIHYSDDGLKFYPISSNPIVDLSKADIDEQNYYSDPHLILVNGKLELYFRFTMLKDRKLESNKTILLRSISDNGLLWSKPEIIADLRGEKDITIWGEQIISQSLIWDGKKYQCWYVDKSSYLQERNIRLTSSPDGNNWDSNVLCKLDGALIDPWHIDVQYYDGKYQMIVYDMHKLIWYESSDGVNFSYVSDILSPSPNRYDFYTDGLYRACSIKNEKNIIVYFSARRKNKTYIGALRTIDRLSFEEVNGIPKLEWLPIIWKPLLKSYFKRIKKLIKIR